MIGSAVESLGDPEDDLRQEAADLLLGIQDKAEYVRFSGPQPQTRPAWMVAKLACHILNGFSRRGTDFDIVMKGARDSRDAQTQCGCDSFQRRFLAAGFQSMRPGVGLLIRDGFIHLTVVPGHSHSFKYTGIVQISQPNHA